MPAAIPNISTGLRINKFGVPLQDARAIYRERRGRAGIAIRRASTSTSGRRSRRRAPSARGQDAGHTGAGAAKDDGFQLEHLDVGGGLGIAYEGRPMHGPSEYAEAVIPELRRSGVPVILEPGRSVVGHAGALVARVVDTSAS